MPVSFRFFLVFAFAFRCVFFFFYLSFNLFGSDPPMSSSLKYPPPCYHNHKHTIKKMQFLCTKMANGTNGNGNGNVYFARYFSFFFCFSFYNRRNR